jgi:hypothetical protein
VHQSLLAGPRTETNQDTQANSDFAKLLDYALSCAIRPGRDDPIVNPPDVDDSTHGLPDVESENCRLSCEPE